MNKKKLVKISVLLIFVIGFFLLRYFGVTDNLSLEYIQSSQQQVTSFVTENYIVSVLFFVVTYIVVVVFSLPGAAVLSLLGGFAFGLIGVAYVNVGATTGALGAFLLARLVLGSSLQAKYEDKLKVINEEIKNSGVNYILMLRLVPVFPFFLVNLLLGLTKISPFTFFWTTAVGIIPGSIVYVYAGKRLGEISSLSDIISAQILSVFVLFGVVSLIPVVIKKIQRKKV